MPRYVRSALPGHTYFFTARAALRGSDVFTEHIDVLRQVMRRTRATHPFEIDEIVVLPDVIHTIWTLPEGDGDFSMRWCMLKSLFSRQIKAPRVAEGMRLRPGETGIWQRRFWDHAIRDAEDLAMHKTMILSAPVQAGFVNRPEHWAYSSVHRGIARGTYAPDPKVGVANRPYVTGRRTGAPCDKTPAHTDALG